MHARLYPTASLPPFKCRDELVDDRKRGVAGAAFQVREIGPVKPCLKGKVFL